MVTRSSLSDFVKDSGIWPLEVQNRVHKILQGSPGLLPITGQIGTGKSTILMMVAYLLFQSGRTVVFSSEEENWSQRCQFDLPEDWLIQTILPTNQAWITALQPYQENPSVVLVVDQLSSANAEAVFTATQAGQWVVIGLDTPFVGLDVLYTLKTWGLNTQTLLNHVAGTISLILLPRLCSQCGQLTLASLEETRLIYPGSYEPQPLWQEVGCPACHHRGIGDNPSYGRCAAFEVLQNTPTIKPEIETYLDQGDVPHHLPREAHLTMRESAQNLVQQGWVGIQIYRQQIGHNPLLRLHNLWEQETARATLIQDLFGRFVTQQLVEKLIDQPNFDAIIEGERRRITCLFCDVRGFTTWSERSSPADVFLMLNRYFRDIIDIVFRYEGTIDKFIGDSVMVVFGAPLAQTDQELRAAQCAIAIQQKVADLNQNNLQQPIQVGIGINSGEVIAGCLGSYRRMDYTVIGDVVNTAARLESVAQPGQILLGPETYRVIHDQVSCRAIGSLKLKGKAQAIEAVEVLYSLN